MSGSLLTSVNGLFVGDVSNTQSGVLFTPFQTIQIENQVGDDIVFAGGIDGWADDTVASNISGLVASDRASIYMNGVGLAIISGDPFNASSSILRTSNGGSSLATTVIEQISTLGTGVLELFQSNMSDVSTSSWNQPIGNTPWQAELDAVDWHPDEAGLNVNWNSDGLIGSTETTAGLSAIQDAHAAGIKTVLPIISPNAGIYGNFATDAQWAGARTLALAGGGLEIDSPSNYFMSNPAAYRNFVAQEIQWANANHLVSMVLVSPYAIGTSFPQANYDPTFLAATESVVKYLQANGAVPTQWSVDNYIAYDGSVNQIGSDLDAESVNGVALWLATNAPTTAEPTQIVGENLGPSGRPIVVAKVAIINSISNTASISSTYGSLSADGETLTISGTDVYVTNALSKMQVGLTQVSGSVDLKITITAGNATYSNIVHLIAQDPTPVITGVSVVTSGQVLNAGKILAFTVTANEALNVSISGGKPLLLLSNGATANFVSSSGNSLNFSYTVQPGQGISDLKVSGLSLNGASLTDASGDTLTATGLAALGGSDTGLDINTTPPLLAPALTVVPENAAATAIAINAPTDPNYSTAQLTITASGLPSNGTVTLADGATAVEAGMLLSSAQLTSLRFIPAAGQFSQSSSFTYSVADPAGNTSTGTAMLQVGPALGAPLLPPALIAVPGNTAATAIGITAPTDPNYSTAQLTITASGLPSDGTVTLADGATAVKAGMLLSSAQLTSLRFIPAAGQFSQSSSFTYSVADPAGNTSTGTAILNIGTSDIALGIGAQNYEATAGMTINLSNGNDTIAAAAGGVTVVGNSGQLVFLGGTGSSSVSGGSGSATLFGGSGGGNFIGGSAGHNILVSQGAASSNTTLTGAAAGDILFGSAKGNDVLYAAQGRESVVGGGGNTTILGGNASNVIFTGDGNSTVLDGSAGGDTVVGGSGSVNLTAQNGDAVFGSAGALTVSGSTSGADSIIGGTNSLVVRGHGGNMLVVAGTSNSDIQTGNGASLIFGTSGNTTLTGGTGSMQVLIGSGNLVVQEGSGFTSYNAVDGSAGGMAVLHGFRPDVDKISLFGYGQSAPKITMGVGFTLISLSDNTKIQLVGVSDLGNSIIG